MSLGCSILNPITFKDLTVGADPNEWNTLHVDLKHGKFKIFDYCQPFQVDETIYLQFYSDSITVPTMYAYWMGDPIEITGVLASVRTGNDTRYFFNFPITLSSATYLNKKVYFKISQGATTLTSEPILVKDYSADIAKGIIKRIKYTNHDRNFSDLSGYFVDWPYIGNEGNYFEFLVEGQTMDVADKDESEILEESQSRSIISSVLFPGLNLKTDAIPAYLVRKLEAASNLDTFLVNGIEYTKDGSVEVERFGNSTSFNCSIKLTQKNALGINVDDLGLISDDMEWLKSYTNDAVVADFDIPTYAGYILHSIHIKHAGSSSGNTATVTCGYSDGDTNIIDAIGGQIADDGKWHDFILHDSEAIDSAQRLYFGISGSGVVLRVWIQFTLIDI